MSQQLPERPTHLQLGCKAIIYQSNVRLSQELHTVHNPVERSVSALCPEYAGQSAP